KDIGFKEQISSDNIEIISMKKDFVVPAAYYGVKPEDLETLYGRLAAIDIKAGTQIYSELLDRFDLVPGEGEFIAPIPNQWLFAVPGSMRRSYYADFYVVLNSAVIDEEELRQGEPLLKDVRVAHTKDNANREVRSIENTDDATGNISNIEIIATKDMLSTIR